ncbi:MAG: M20/M25/M40 family metallo-hydrolase [Myxococcales bacterium]|nr:M20/M25/M40 family metallo-hydrolase [Myxococcales bacterium]
MLAPRLRPSHRTWWRSFAAPALVLALAACPGKRGDPSETPEGQASAAASDPWAAAGSVNADKLRAHLAFLADDAQEGRAPGTEADKRVQDYIVAAYQAAGLTPGFSSGYVQPFDLTDGVRIVEGKTPMLAAGKTLVPHGLVPWGHSTANDGPVLGKMIYVGYGIATEGLGTGDYKGLKNRVGGRIVVARAGGPDDPHLTPASTRPQTKLITARDHGAGGFVLWEPDIEAPYPNHGAVTELEIPAVSVGKVGTPALLKIFGKKPPKEGDKDPHLGLVPGDKSARQAVLDTPVEPVQLKTANVAGVLKGSGASPRSLVVGAHMDHLGMGTNTSLAPGERAVHNGADDNASGVAAMLELAALIAKVPAAVRPYDITFVAFGAEEMGLLGSRHMVEGLGSEAAKGITAMLNFDMVGRLRDGSVVVSGLGTSSVWPGLVEGQRGELKVQPSQDGYGASDQTSFYEAGIPVLHFFSGTHDDYHKPSDDLDKINIPGAASIAQLAFRVIGALMRDRVEPDFIKVAESSQKRGGFRVSLGTVPDYAAQVDGVKLSGVRPGGAADKAGLQKGDVIQKLGAREVHNMDDYMAAFATMNPGEEIPVQILRGEETLSLKLVPDAPRSR